MVKSILECDTSFRIDYIIIMKARILICPDPVEEVAEAASEEAASAAVVAEAASVAEATAEAAITIIIGRSLEAGSIDLIITEAAVLAASSVCLCYR